MDAARAEHVARARLRKAEKLARALVEAGATTANFDIIPWDLAVEVAGVRPPSDDTKQLVYDLLEFFEERAALPDRPITNNPERKPPMTNYTIVKRASRNFTVEADGQAVATSDGEPIRYKSKTEAQADVDAWLADEEAVQTDQATTAAVDDIAAMDRVKRVLAAKVEAEALSDWRRFGGTDRPSTPILDWMADPTTKPQRRSNGNGNGHASPRTPEQDAEFDRIVGELYPQGAKFSAISRALTEAEIPRSRSGRTDWTSGWVKAVAASHRLELSC